MRKQILITAFCFLTPMCFTKSLWTSKVNNEHGMYADRKATAVGDILTIQVSEEVIVNRSLSRNSSTTSLIDQNFEGIIWPGILDADDTLPSINNGGSESFNGGGTVSDSSLLEARIAVMVVDVQPNGNLVIEGARKVRNTKDTQYLVVRGIVRADDVMAGNTVMSYNVLNAGVELFGEGDLENAQTKGWIQRLIDMTNVF